jgi:hypothetical protein
VTPGRRTVRRCAPDSAGLGPADPDRRALMLLIGAALIPTLSACSNSSQRPTESTTNPRGVRAALPPDMFSAPPSQGDAVRALSRGLPRIPGPRPGPSRVLGVLPGNAKDLALTIDDGTDETVIVAYARFAQSSGIKLTFFPNGLRPGWTQHAPLLRPMIESGQVQIGNHTWSHPDVTTLGDAAVAEEITSNEAFIQSTFGVTARPYFRPHTAPTTPAPTTSPQTSATPTSPSGTARSATPHCSPPRSYSPSPNAGSPPGTSCSATPNTRL